MGYRPEKNLLNYLVVEQQGQNQIFRSLKSWSSSKMGTTIPFKIIQLGFLSCIAQPHLWHFLPSFRVLIDC